MIAAFNDLKGRTKKVKPLELEVHILNKKLCVFLNAQDVVHIRSIVFTQHGERVSSYIIRVPKAPLDYPIGGKMGELLW